MVYLGSEGQIMQRALLALTLIAVLVVGVVRLSASNGPDQLQGPLLERGWASEDLRLTAGIYSNGFLSQSAQGWYDSTDPDRPGQVMLKIQRSTPLQSWGVAEFSYEPSEE